MKVSVYGMENSLEFERGEIGELNIHNKLLYRNIMNYFMGRLSLNESNEIVFLDEDRRIKSDSILYIQDLMTFEVDTKKILDRVIKRYSSINSQDILVSEEADQVFRCLLKPLLEELNLLEVDYGYRQHFDVSLYSKIAGISFDVISLDNDPIQKLISIFKLYMKLWNIQIFVVNRLDSLLTYEEMDALKQYIGDNSIALLIIDKVIDDDVVIANNLCIAEDLGSYHLNTMI